MIKSIRWWAVVLFFAVHIHAFILLRVFIEEKDILGCFMALVVLFSPPELYPSMRKK